MKLQSIETFVVANPPPRRGGRYFIFVELKTACGITGVGEIYNATFSPHLCAQMAEDVFARIFEGADPHHIERLWHRTYGAGYTMTRRDLQGRMKELGRPWEIGKAFENAAPCSDLAPAEGIGHPEKGAIWLKVNGEIRQHGNLDQMIWKTPEMISTLSGLFTLRAGDLILTGTPSGVGPVQRGDKLHGHD